MKYFVCLMVLCLLGCSADIPLSSAQVSLDAPYVHKIQEGDALKISVFGENDLSREYRVGPTGVISFPYIGELNVLGLTADQVAALLWNSLRDDYIKDPEVSVDITNLRPIYVLGEVNKPGSYDFDEDLNVVRAVALAGGFTHRANKENFDILRGKKETQTSTHAGLKTALYPGDTIVVKERYF